MNNEQNSKNCNSILHGFQVKRNDKSKSEDTAKKKKEEVKPNSTEHKSSQKYAPVKVRHKG